MAVTLEQFKKSTTDKVVEGFINEIQADSAFLDALLFDDVVSPNGGSNLNYVYTRELTGSTAAFRALNTEYTPDEAEIEQVVTELAILGGSFQIDRVVANATSGSRIVDQMSFQLAAKRRAVIQGYYNALINGDTGTDANAFDGLKKALANGDQELTSAIDVSDAAKMDDAKMAFADEMDRLIMALDGMPGFIIANRSMKGKIAGIARRLGVYQATATDAGARVETSDGIPFFDPGQFGANDIIPVTEGKTDIYAVRIGIDGLHGLSVDGGKLVDIYTPDLTAPGAVKLGEVEFVCGMALKKQKAAAVLKGIQVAPAA